MLQRVLPYTVILPQRVTRLFLVFSVSEFQEEGMNAINLPLSPISFELDPEDTMLGNCPLVSSLVHTA